MWFTKARMMMLNVGSVAVLLSGCARNLESLPDWAPGAEDGWEIREVEREDVPSWVLYERDSSLADVKEFRIIGTVDAQPQVVMDAARERLLDDQYLPEGLEREILVETDEEIIFYGLMPTPLTMRDREVTEHLVFSDDPVSGVYRMDGREIDSDVPSAQGVLRIPLARNSVVVEPMDELSLLTNVSVHDIGGAFPNWVTYKPTRKQLIEDLDIVRDLSR